MTPRMYAWWSTRLSLPVSAAARQWRATSRRLRNKHDPAEQATRLPSLPWHCATDARRFGVWEAGRNHGDVRTRELAVLAAFASRCPDATTLFEIGTFDGRTTFNLAMNSPPGCRIGTLDLPPDAATAMAIDTAERSLVDKPSPGRRYERNRARHPAAVAKIFQLLGDSATFDFQAHRRACSLVFVDGSHAAEYVERDTATAFDLVRPGGVVLWHDYGTWEGVTGVLERIDAERRLGLRSIRGTSLVMWRNG